MIQKYEATLQNNKGTLQGDGFLDGCDIELNAPPVLDGEIVPDFNKELWNAVRDVARKFEISWSCIGDSKPTGPIVDSTLAEKVEESNENIEHDNQR